MNKLNEFLKRKIKNKELILRLCKYLKQDKKETEKIVKKVLRDRCFSCGRFLRECNQYPMIVKCYLKDYASWITKQEYEQTHEEATKKLKAEEIERALKIKGW